MDAATSPIIAKLFAQADAEEAELVAIAAAIGIAKEQGNAAEVGRLLFQAKDLVPFGEWQAWIADLGIPYFDANLSMRLYKQTKTLANRMAHRVAAE